MKTREENYKDIIDHMRSQMNGINTSIKMLREYHDGILDELDTMGHFLDQAYSDSKDLDTQIRKPRLRPVSTDKTAKN